MKNIFLTTAVIALAISLTVANNAGRKVRGGKVQLPSTKCIAWFI